MSVHKWPFFPWAAFSAGLDPQSSQATPAVKTLVRPCPEKKLLIYESDTHTCAHQFFNNYGWTLINAIVFLVPVDEPLNTSFKGCVRPEPDVSGKIIDIGECRRHITRLHISHLLFGQLS